MEISIKTLPHFPLNSKGLLESAHVFTTKYFLIVYYYFGLQSVSLSITSKEMELVISGTKVKLGVRSRNLTKCNRIAPFSSNHRKCCLWVLRWKPHRLLKALLYTDLFQDTLRRKYSPSTSQLEDRGNEIQGFIFLLGKKKVV